MLYAQVHLTLPAWVHDVDTTRTYFAHGILAHNKLP